MRIGIMTYWSSSDNYGQVLQCYALQRYLRGAGHDAYLIRYIRPSVKETLFRRLKRNLSIKQIQYKLTKEGRMERMGSQKRAELSKRNLLLNKQRDFEGFRKANIVSTDITFLSVDELRHDPPKADMYICGSDQVWNNPLKEKETAAYFLQFGNKSTRRVSYAASIGREIKNNEKKRFRKYLSTFHAISVREDKAKILCDSLGFPQAEVVVDPTILLPITSFEPLYAQVQAPKEDYILVYVLNVATQEELYWNTIGEWVKEQQLQTKVIYSSGYLPANDIIEGQTNTLATIPEWLSYIQHANSIITTSFHGVVFCVKMHKPFLAILLTNKYKGGNNRIISFLDSIGLSNRIYDPQQEVGSQMSAPINWEEVETKLATMRESSIQFIDNFLKE